MNLDITVGEYARSRGTSETNVKKYIRTEEWELRQNPRDGRQRLLSPEQQLYLDSKYSLSVQTAVPAVQTYERSAEIAEVIIQGELVKADPSYSQLAVVEDNPYLVAINQKLTQVTHNNQIQFAQIQEQALAANDLDAAILSLQEQAAIQRGQQRAIREAQLEQTAYQATQTQIKMAQAGIAPIAAPAPNAPAASPAATPEPSESSPAVSSGQPF